jgi:hypothetical protein
VLWVNHIVFCSCATARLLPGQRLRTDVGLLVGIKQTSSDVAKAWGGPDRSSTGGSLQRTVDCVLHQKEHRDAENREPLYQRVEGVVDALGIRGGHREAAPGQFRAAMRAGFVAHVKT